MCAELLITQHMAWQVMQIATDRWTTWCSSGLLPGGWKLEIFGTNEKCLMWCWSHHVLQGRAFGKGLLISGACLAPSRSPAVVKDEQRKIHLGSAGCSGSRERNPPNRRKKGKYSRGQENTGKQEEEPAERASIGKGKKLFNPFSLVWPFFFFTAPFDRSHFPAMFSYICDISFWYLLFM